MKHQNKIKCDSCGQDNPIYSLNCVSCNAYLRERVVNIDLWASIWALFETPIIAFKKIIFAEHKNFVSFITIIISIKLFFDSLFLKGLLFENEELTPSTFNGLLTIIFAVFIFLILSSSIKKLIYKGMGIDIRLKDNYSVTIFSFMPMLFALFMLAPVEYALFGKYWFTFNPSPFMIKENAAFVLAGIEGVLLLWSFILLGISIYTITSRKIFSILYSLFESFLLILLLIFMPYF